MDFGGNTGQQIKELCIMTSIFPRAGQGVFVWLAAVLLLAAGWAQAADTPHSLAGATVVTAEQARQLMDKGAVMIDARVANEYVEAHIQGARNVPYKEKSAKAVGYDASRDRFNLSKLPADKNAAVIFACNGPECWKSYKASEAAIKAGYKKVYWLRGGFPEWKAKGFPVE
jgi:rhodanese-related sulfurtransferase